MRSVDVVTPTLAESTTNPLLSGWTHQLERNGGPVTVVLAEGDDPRVRKAAQQLPAQGVSPLLICESDSGALAGVQVRSVAELVAGPAGALVRWVGAERDWPQDVAVRRAQDPLYLAAACVASGAASACVAGATRPTGEVLRAGLHIIGLAPRARLVSSSFLLLPPTGSPIAFGDCAVVPEPDEEQLADIAISTARTYRDLVARTPKVAMLSFSTLGSAEHESALRVRRATELVRQRAPWLLVDGELQFDAAYVSTVADAKASGSAVAGAANVFIFPNLSAGNIGYKIAQRLAGAEAFGPVIQGLAAPMNDLSRGCSVNDIVNVAVISAVQGVCSQQPRPTSPAPLA